MTTIDATPEQRDASAWLAVADELAARLAPEALRRDRENALAHAELQLLRDSGLANLLIPARFDGAGADWETAFAVVRTLARADASLGQIVGYHYLNQACILFYGSDPEVQERLWRTSARERWIWSDSFNPVGPDLQLRWDGAVYRLSGTKRFATGAAVADVVIAGAIASGGPDDGEFVIFVLNADRDGIEHLSDWDNLGYRASASGSVKYTDVAVHAEDLLGFDRGIPFSTLVTPGVQLLFGNIYLAIAQAALRQARELVLARNGAWGLASVARYADDPVFQRVVGELVARTAAVEALADKLNANFDLHVAHGPGMTANQRAVAELEIAALKVVATEVSLDVTARVYEVTGASSTASRNGLDLHWRNVRTHSLHDPVEYKKVEVGANFLTGAVQPITLYS